MTFLEHLDDLRKRIFYSLIAIIGAVIPAWFFSKFLYKILALPVTQFLPEGKNLVFTSLTAPFLLYMKVSFLAAVLATAPFLFLQVWYFVAPGLYKKEKKHVVPFVLFTSFFFMAGAVFAYFIVFPLGIALVFELPTLVFFLSKMGIITARWMIKYFKYAVLLIFILAAIITPTPDPITQSIVAFPMLGLYGLSILIAFIVGKKREKKKKKSEEDLAG
jgi:sec-independent protein translocase protein TatC